MTKFLIASCVVLAAAAFAGFIVMVVLLTKAPSAEVPFAGGGTGYIRVDCRSIVDAADAEDTDPSDDHVTDVDAETGNRTPANDRPQLAWCADERTARAGLMALLAVPATLSAAGSMLTGGAARRRPT